MTVKQLIIALLDYPGDAEVFIWNAADEAEFQLDAVEPSEHAPEEEVFLCVEMDHD
ncbi:MAG TPA: hypothetical protein VM531_09015 [Sphingomicrobium sp.]|jgi:hypothetical protein|nr:hypothetical protein [Sphingomicrobium sp.]